MPELVIERLGLQGDGMAGPVRAPFTLPGERVSGAVEDDILELSQVLEASPARIEPACQHFGTCGGCTLQHASDPFLAEWKRMIIERALAAHGLSCNVLPPLVSPPGSRRRAVLSGRRTKKTVVLGFYRRRSQDLTDVHGCPLIRPEILAERPALVRLVELGASRKNPVRLAVTVSPDGLDVDVSDARAAGMDLRAALAEVAGASGIIRLSWNGEAVFQRALPFQKMGRALVAPPPGAFLQATAEGAAALAAAVRGAVGPAASVVDLFAGCGTFALPLAQRASVHAVEGEAGMLAALDAGWRNAAGLKRVSTECRDLFRRPLLPAELGGYDAAVIDPPRAGGQAQVAEIARSAVPKVTYVSCNPVTFARDAAVLREGGYRLDWVQPVDQFRWSGHVELAARFFR